MKRLLFLGLLMMLGVSLTFLSGCDEDEATNPPEKAVGDTLDPIFVAIEEGFKGVDEATGFLLDQSIGFVLFILYDTSESVAGKVPFGTESLESASDSVVFTYHSSSQYWYFYVSSADTSGDTVLSLTFEDSIQFLHGDNPVQWPDSTELTGIKAGISFSMYMTPGDTLSASQNFTIFGDIPGFGDVVINGNGQVTAAGDFDSDSLGSCHGSLIMTQTISDVDVNLTDLEEENACPNSGVIYYTGAVNLECVGDGSLEFHDNWTITQTFSGDYITTVFENSTTVWTVTYTCGGGSAAPWNRFTGISRNLD